MGDTHVSPPSSRVPAWDSVLLSGCIWDPTPPCGQWPQSPLLSATRKPGQTQQDCRLTSPVWPRSLWHSPLEFPSHPLSHSNLTWGTTYLKKPVPATWSHACPTPGFRWSRGRLSSADLGRSDGVTGAGRGGEFTDNRPVNRRKDQFYSHACGLFSNLNHSLNSQE